MSKESTVTKRIRDTKREIEVLNLELKSLINNGINAKSNLNTNVAVTAEKCDEEVDEKKIKLSPKPTPKELKPVTDKPQRETSPAKTRSYDVEKAREFIKRQREQRKELQKTKVDISKLNNEIKKQKLKELQAKQLELVAKNVQLKRERSKSRERGEPIRLQGPVRERSRSRSREPPPKAIPDKVCKRFGKTSKTSTVTKPKGPNIPSELLLHPPEVDLGKTSYNPPRTPQNSPSEASLKKNLLLQPPELNLNKSRFELELEGKNDSPPETALKSEHVLQEIRAKLLDSPRVNIDKNSTGKSKTNCRQASDEPPLATPSSYNFINSVKRKLKIALEVPKILEKGVQSSELLLKQTNDRQEATSKSSKSENHSSQKRSRLEEIKPEKVVLEVPIENFKLKEQRPNLNLETVKNLELMPSRSAKKLNFESTNSGESDSGTSKNIPDISSECSKALTNNEEIETRSSQIKILSGSFKVTNSQENSPKTYSSDFNISTNNSSSKSPKSKSSGKENKLNSNTSLSQTKHSSSKSKEHTKSKSSLDLIDQKVTKQSFKSLLSDYSSDSPATVSTHTKTTISKISVIENSAVSFKPLETPETSVISSVKSLKESDPAKNPIELNDVNKETDIVVRKSSKKTMNKTNEIHLKFEAEVHLLNDFNESIKQFMAVEKAYENLKNNTPPKILQNADTQTSNPSKSISDLSIASSVGKVNSTNSSINFSRGSGEILGGLSNFNIDQDSTESSIMEITKLNDVDEVDNLNVSNCTGMSLRMFEQLIKDEDARFENLKAIIRIREKALLDRTKGELAWLEVQRKQLIENGKLEEASIVKKKQRGILLRHEQERNEMKKLKQMQKVASQERKNILKQQRSVIKSQLSTKNMLSKIKVNTMRERRQSGPLKVIQNSESIKSETSTRRSSGVEEILTSQHSLAVTSREDSDSLSDPSSLNHVPNQSKTKKEIADARRSLHMRELALEKRKKEAEDLLKWHQKLIEKEKEILELESIANDIIKKNSDLDNLKHKFTGKHLNKLWNTMTDRNDKKFNDNNIYVVTQMSLEKFCKSARNYNNKNKKITSQKDIPQNNNNDNDNDYSLTFDSDSNLDIILNHNNNNNNNEEKINDDNDDSKNKNNDDVDDEDKISSLSKLMDNFSRLEDEIFMLHKQDISVKPIELNDNDNDNRNDQKISNKDNQQLKDPISEEEIKTVCESDSSKNVPEIQTQSEQFLTEEINIESGNLDLKENEEPSTVEESLQKSEKSLEKLEEIKTEKEEEAIVECVETEESPIDDLNIEKIDEVKSKTESVIESLPDKEASETVETNISSKVFEVESLNSAFSESISHSKDNINTDTVQSSYIPIEENNNKSSPDVSALADVQNDKNKDETSQILTQIEDKEIEEINSDKQQQEKSDEIKIDVKQRVSEILADAYKAPNDKSPSFQDLYVTTYDVTSPRNSPESSNESADDGKPISLFGNEAEELFKKQLAIEQEIKQLEQQQKEHLPYIFVREIPNKPPPPYTPPATTLTTPLTILPTDNKETREISNYSSNILYKAYLMDNLKNIKFSEKTFKLASNLNMDKEKCEFMFNICKELTIQHYSQFNNANKPSWHIVCRRNQLITSKPLDAIGLNKHLNNKLDEIFGYKKPGITQSAIIKWSRKKRDHVDEVLVLESQEEESQWINYDEDELLVKDQLTNDILNGLIQETTNVFKMILKKKHVLY